MVRPVGLEPTREVSYAPQTYAYTNSAMAALKSSCIIAYFLSKFNEIKYFRPQPLVSFIFLKPKT